MTGFLGSGIVERAVGASFLYLLIAAFCSTVNEWVSALLNARARMLKAALHALLNRQLTADGTEFITGFYAHPIIKAMMDNLRHPAHLSPRSFVTAVVDLATPAIEGPISFADLRDSLAELPAGDLRTSLLALMQNAQGDLTRGETNIENWFNDAMSRASTSYRQRTALWTAVTAAALTVALNADTLVMLRDFSLPGWQGAPFPTSPSAWLARISGWSLTVAAVSLGAPFWFVVLKRVVKPRTR
ncbi:MAG: hypothetical protein M3N54_02250 [Acidobacteriota bacterium]|nr:hypothetical protein [Acidobacteriota bacterium]